MHNNDENQLEKNVNDLFKGIIRQVEYLNDFFPKNLFRYKSENYNVNIVFDSKEKRLFIIGSDKFIDFSEGKVHSYVYNRGVGTSITHEIKNDGDYASPEELYQEFVRSCYAFKINGQLNRFYEGILFLNEQYDRLKEIRTELEEIKKTV